MAPRHTLYPGSGGGKTVKQIVLTGERFDALSVQNWRKKVLGGK
jgi:hypothetical protein